ncbi:hypothetical protein ACM9HJ_27400 [Niveispirillum sp. KHB5.9]
MTAGNFEIVASVTHKPPQKGGLWHFCGQLMEFCAPFAPLRIFFATVRGNVAQQHARLIGDPVGNPHNPGESAFGTFVASELLKGVRTPTINAS